MPLKCCTCGDMEAGAERARRERDRFDARADFTQAKPLVLD